MYASLQLALETGWFIVPLDREVAYVQVVTAVTRLSLDSLFKNKLGVVSAYAFFLHVCPSNEQTVETVLKQQTVRANSSITVLCFFSARLLILLYINTKSIKLFSKRILQKYLVHIWT